MFLREDRTYGGCMQLTLTGSRQANHGTLEMCAQRGALGTANTLRRGTFGRDRRGRIRHAGPCSVVKDDGVHGVHR